MKFSIKNIRYYTISCFIALSISAFAQEDEDEPVEELDGEWAFSIGDNMKWANPEYDDSDWEMIEVPSSWEGQGFQNYDGYAWYRKKAIISKSYKDEKLILKLGYIDDVDEVYFNGTLIGKTGSVKPNLVTGYNIQRRYEIPSNLIRYNKENTIAVRVYDIGMVGGIVGGDIEIVSNLASFNPEISLQGTWDFSKGQVPITQIDEIADWTKVFVPAAWETQGFAGYDGYGIYKKTFYVNKNQISERMVVLLGKIDELDEAYLNGNLIGKTGDYKRRQVSREFEKTRNYFISSNQLRTTGPNTLVVFVFDAFGRGGIYEGTIGIISQERFIEHWRKIRKQREY